ncbi:hypothetical protein GQ53DRAFT_292406 [Thozetella sp. PMI_491]|nr:hypothetical protein GQ53DRAFT_292406 [Thozetella sp. PMI_491]
MHVPMHLIVLATAAWSTVVLAAPITNPKEEPSMDFMNHILNAPGPFLPKEGDLVAELEEPSRYLPSHLIFRPIDNSNGELASAIKELKGGPHMPQEPKLEAPEADVVDEEHYENQGQQ